MPTLKPTPAAQATPVATVTAPATATAPAHATTAATPVASAPVIAPTNKELTTQAIPPSEQDAVPAKQDLTTTQNLPAEGTPLTEGVIAPLTDNQVRQCEKFVQQPMGQKTLTLFTSTEVGQNFERVRTNPNLANFFYTEIAWILVFFVLQAWMLSFSQSWYRKTWTKTWTLLTFFFICVLTIPLIFFGRDYIDLLHQILSILRG